MRRTNPVPSPYQGRCTLGFHAKIRGCTRVGVKLVLSWYGFDPWMDTPKREQIASTSWCSCWVVCRLFPSSPPSDPMPIFGYFYFGNPRTNWENRAGENGRTLDVMGVENVYGSAQSTANLHLQQALLQGICCHSSPLHPLSFNGSLRLAILPRGVADAHMATTA